MIKKIVLSFVGIIVLAAVGAAAYFYYGAAPSNVIPGLEGSPGESAPLVQSNLVALAGPITALSATSITIQKQDGTTATLTISPATEIWQAGQEGGNKAVQKSVSDIKVGTMVLITPAQNDATLAQSIAILTPSPTL
jgi:hypothetical protein